MARMVTDLDQIQSTNTYYYPSCICYPAFYIIKLWYVICVHLRIDDYVLFCNFYSDIHLNKSIIVRYEYARAHQYIHNVNQILGSNN